MHPDLVEAVETAKMARTRVLEAFSAPLEAQNAVVKAGNTVAANNQTVIMAHAITLRRDIFVHEQRTIPPWPSRNRRGGKQPEKNE